MASGGFRVRLLCPEGLFYKQAVTASGGFRETARLSCREGLALRTTRRDVSSIGVLMNSPTRLTLSMTVMSNVRNSVIW